MQKINLETMTDTEKWAAIGQQHEMLNQCKMALNQLKQSLAATEPEVTDEEQVCKTED